MIEQFKKDFDQLIKWREWPDEEAITTFFDKYWNPSPEQWEYILSELQKYTPSKNLDYIWWFNRIIFSLRYKTEKYNLTNEKVVDFLKQELEFQLQQDKPAQYSWIIDALFALNRKDALYYQSQYDTLKKKKVYSDINTSFLHIFIALKNNDYFLETFQEELILNISEIKYFSVLDGFNYINLLGKSDFNSLVVKLLTYFDNDDNKFRLIHFHQYHSLIREQFWERHNNQIQIFFKNIEKNFWEQEITILKNFLFHDINFSIEHHDYDIEKNYFITGIINIFYKKEKNFVLEIGKNLSKEYSSWWLQNFFIKYLRLSDLNEFIQIFEGIKDEYILYSLYDRFKLEKSKKAKDFTNAFESSQVGNKIKERNKRIEEEDKKREKEKAKRIAQEKENFFALLNPEKWTYNPKLFQDYVQYLERKEGFSIFNSEEKKRIDDSLIKQIKTYLWYRKIVNFNTENFKYVTYQKKENNSFSYTWEFQYVNWIIKVWNSLPEVKKLLESDYKISILFYPLAYWDGEENGFLDFFSEKIDTHDIEYILKVYSEDLHENAVDLRFFQPRNLTKFYEKNKKSFSRTQKEKLKKILLELIYSDKIWRYDKENLTKTVLDVWGEKEIRKFWNELKREFSKFNYFTDILESKTGSNKDILERKGLFLAINTIIIENKKVRKKEDVLWRIKQLLTTKIKARDRFSNNYWRFWVFEVSGDWTYRELEFFWIDRYDFAYIFWIISDIDIKSEILNVLDNAFKLQSQKDWADYQLYVSYLKQIFFRYINTLPKNKISKNFYFRIKDVLSKFETKYTYYFNLTEISEKAWVNDDEDIAYDIIKKWDLEAVKSLLRDSRNQANHQSKQIEKEKEQKERKNIIFVEWPTDISYILHAANILLEEDENISKDFEIRIIGSIWTSGSTINSNDEALKNWGRFLIDNPDFIPENYDKVIFLHDPENKVEEGEFQNGRLYIKKMILKDGYLEKGIESLFEENFLRKAKKSKKECFKTITTEEGDNKYIKTIIVQWKKSLLCDWICKNWEKDDFEWFRHIFDMMREVLWINKEI